MAWVAEDPSKVFICGRCYRPNLTLDIKNRLSSDNIGDSCVQCGKIFCWSCSGYIGHWWFKIGWHCFACCPEECNGTRGSLKKTM